MLFPLRFVVAYVLERTKHLIGKVLWLIRTTASRTWQGVARLFGHRVVYLSDAKSISMLSIPLLEHLKQAASERKSSSDMRGRSWSRFSGFQDEPGWRFVSST